MYDAYVRIFDRCGLKTRVVEADTGAMGGKWSHEFMVPSESGEDGIVECGSCAYAANMERAERAAPSAAPVPPPAAAPLPEEVATPGKRTIDEVSAFLGCAPASLVKTLVYSADGSPVAVLAAGDRDVNEGKLARALGAKRVALADAAAIEKVTGAPVGFAGPIGLRVPVVADIGLRGAADAVTGGNKADTHLRHVCLARDASVAAYHDLCFARQGDACPRCGSALRERRGIEVGHVFKLGTKYSESFGAGYLDEGGSEHPLVMGCYGIGVTRTLQAIVEQCRDEKGIAWPVSVAPYRVAVLALNPLDDTCMQAARVLCDQLASRGLDSLLDDRNERAGVKFNDADLLGFPVRVVVSQRSLADGGVEVKRRTEQEKHTVPLQAAAERIADLCRA
jgi:prolyl-tRNA synthetase